MKDNILKEVVYLLRNWKFRVEDIQEAINIIQEYTRDMGLKPENTDC